MRTYLSKRPAYKVEITREFTFLDSEGEEFTKTYAAEVLAYQSDYEMELIINEVLSPFEAEPIIKYVDDDGNAITLYYNDQQEESREIIIGDSLTKRYFEIGEVVDFVEVESNVPDGWILLDTNKILFRWQFPDSPKLNFINSFGMHPYDLKIFKRAGDFNLSNGDFATWPGRYFTNQKGSHFFEYDIHGPHILIRDELFNQITDPTESEIMLLEMLYTQLNEVSKNGERYIYAVVPKDELFKASIQDF